MKIIQVMPCGNITPVRFDNYTTRTNAELLMLQQLVYMLTVCFEVREKLSLHLS
jgi:hypothetical protein